MSNADFSEIKRGLGGRATSPPKPPSGAGPASAKEKPAFPSASLPGKTQPRDRSSGTRRAWIHPKSEGL